MSAKASPFFLPMQQTHYDILIAGGGAAGRILLYFLSKEADFSKWNILVVESENKIADKTWCFWNKQEHPFQQLICKQWNQVSFAANHFYKTEQIAPYAYCCIRGKDFDHFFQTDFFPRHSNIAFRNETMLDYRNNNGTWELQTHASNYTCSQLFTNMPAANNSNRLKQHFHGWFIEYDQPIFDPNKAMLMDFSAAEGKGFTFFYVLPFDTNKALVECTYYSTETLSIEAYEKELQAYILHHFGAGFSIAHTENGSIPLIEEKPATTLPNHYLIGQSAGMIKASTGYAFQRMTEDAALIAASMGTQLQRRKRHPRFRFYDRLLLCIMRENPEKAVAIFKQLFKRQSITEILIFLDEDSSLMDEIKIFLQLPWWPFIKRIWKVI